MEGSEEVHHSTSDPKVRLAYNWRENKALAILALNLSDSQLSHIRSCKTFDGSMGQALQYS